MHARSLREKSCRKTGRAVRNGTPSANKHRVRRKQLLGTLCPAELGRALRSSDARYVKNRRWIVGLSVFSTAIMGGIGLYQMGILRNIPEPPWPRFDAKKVNGSAQAYSILHTPDALLGAVSYSATACLAGASDPDRARTAPWIPLSMGAKLALDGALAAKLTSDEWTKHRAFCFWCLLSTAATFVAAGLGAPEVIAAGREITSGE
jgi:uncharacterized membrane protein